MNTDQDTLILTDVKNFLGYAHDDDSFNNDILIVTNLALSTLNQLGVGTEINATEDTNWSEFIPTDVPKDVISLPMIKAYASIKCKILFDPPAPSTLNIMDKEATNLESRLQCGWDTYSRKEIV